MHIPAISRRGSTQKRRAMLPVVLATMTGLPLLLIGTTAVTASASPAPITIAYITDVTGEGGSQNSTSPAGFEARLDLQNAQGGVNGHKLVPLVIDDQTNPSEIATAVQSAISKGAFGIVSQSPLMFLAAKYPQQAGLPVTGTYDDGPEWGQQPYTNMFAADNGSVDPKYPVNTQLGDLFKKLGATTIGAYGYGISPSSSRAALGTADSFKHAGGKVGVLDTTVPFGSVNFTSMALVAKQDHVDALSPAMDANSNYALATALKQAGVKIKAAIYATGYQPDVIKSPVWKTLRGGYFLSLFRPWSLPNAGTQQMQVAMEKYAHFSKTDFPNFGQYESWAGADLMIKGLQMAGANPTRAAVIKDLRSIKSYNVNGLLPVNLNYATNFGHNPPKTCAWIMKAGPNGFTAISSQPSCGTDLPGTSTAGSS